MTTALGQRRSTATVRFAWGVLVGLSLSLFVLSVPARYAELTEVARRTSTQLGLGDDLLHRFLSQGAYYALTALSLEIAFVLALALAAAAVVWHNWSDWRPPFFSAVFVTYSVWVTPTLDALTLPSVFQALADLTQAMGVLMAVSFFLLFPDGRFVPSWTRLSALGWAIYCLAWGLFPDMPLSLIDPFEASFAAFLILMVLGWTLGLLAQAVRYRRAGPRQRVQTKWVLLVVAGACAGYAAVYLPDVLLPASGSARLLYDLFGVPVFWLLALPMPVAIVIAILRYRLFDASLFINRTLVYGSLTAMLALVYASSVMLLRTLAFGFTGQTSRLTVVASTLVVAALFNPLRYRIQSFIDRRFYRSKYDARKTFEAFCGKLRGETDLEALNNELVGVVKETMQPAHVSLWLRSDAASTKDKASG
ncbi:MAG TPA: hypothetical protein VK988_09790 [Acidimicrobiales bacterium]|nr:hypothetical protein [Acidimicrobiales bacterium]